ncbi:MAG: peptide chain release factor N(5)-glutamine methyltransferase [Kordiimonadaceae bacterium]|nr:peptide chain release factor N(5)-glutamine methyltransferase [Kordiimonadaceae bacterium]MBT6033287.1 peptide chain release factor N(5)-glutamine methyltransferase [Kordiimonadaceae bacterium]
MKTLSSLKLETVCQLKEVQIEEAALDAQLLITHVLEINPVDYAIEGDLLIDDKSLTEIQRLVDLRLSRMPMSQIFGDKEFWSLNFKVTKDTLTPRPDSETLIEACLKEINNPKAKLRILDMGTGTGCLLLTLLSEFPNAKGLGTDISEKALSVAKENAKNLSLLKRADFQISNWTKNLADQDKFDIIISNPPYIGLVEKESLSPEVRDHEPDTALFSGPEGLNDYRLIADQVFTHLKPDGLIIIEVGHTQADNVKEIFISSGFNNITVYKDLGHRNRCLVIRQ